MFGFSLQKLLILAALVGAVWYGFKLISRLQQNRELERMSQASGDRSAAKPAAGSAGKQASPATEDMVQCPVCQAYVAARGTGSCGRSDCPY